MYTSITLVPLSKFIPHTCPAISFLESTLFLLAISISSNVNSFVVNCISLPARVTVPLLQSTIRSAILYVFPEKGAGAEFTEIAPEDRNTVLRLIHQKTRDRRLNPRAPLATQVQCDQCMSLAFSRDISLGGMFIETDDLLPVGSALSVRFNIDKREKVVTASAKVTYRIEKMGMGVVFTEIGEEDCDAIRRYLEDLPAVTSTDPAKSGTA